MKNFHNVRNNLWRGSAPTSEEVEMMHELLGIDNIISLDEESGKNITDVCKKLNIEHHIIPIDPGNRKTLRNLFKQNLSQLLHNKKTYAHCFHGRDRLGLFIALVRCLLDGWTAKEAIQEARKLKFGVGLDASTEMFYTKLIKRVGSPHDTNEVNDIRSNIVDLNREYRDDTIDSPFPLSFAPYAETGYRQFPIADLYHEGNEWYQTRENFGLKDIKYMDDEKKPQTVPQVGILDFNTSVTNYVGPSLVGGGFV